MTAAYAQVNLPWDTDEKVESRFRGILIGLLVIGLIFATIVAWTTLPEPQPRKQAELPERLVQLVLEKKKREEVKPPLCPPPTSTSPSPRPPTR